MRESFDIKVEDLPRIAGDATQATCLDADICIVGSGPAGLTIARELSDTKLQILVVESGGLTEDPQADALSEIESVGAPRVMDPTKVRNRIFGGSSQTWSGRCAPLDAIDYAHRPWVPLSGWPVDAMTMAPYFDRAALHLDLEPFDNQTAEEPTLLSSEMRHCLWQFSRDQRGSYTRSGPAFLRRPGLRGRVLLHATATEITTADNTRHVTGIVVKSTSGATATIRARTVILCGGGIENARLLLNSRQDAPQGLGNAHDVVGRYLMDHPRCTIGTFEPGQAGVVQDRYGLFRPRGRRGRNYFVRGLGLSPEVQERDGLLNCAAWMSENRAPGDPWEAIRRVLVARRPGDRLAAMPAALSHPVLLADGALRLIGGRRGVRHLLSGLDVECIVEQRPDAESRLTLGHRQDALGMQVSRIDWRISDQERVTVATLATSICREFAAQGLEPPRLADWIVQSQWSEARFRDVAHPIGTTRMGLDPRSSVVNADAQVHGVGGLYVAGSSVFPTAGHANPTYMIVAMAIRLADHLRQRPA